MRLTYLGTAASEGLPALFCECEHCKKAREAGGKSIRTRSQALIDDALLVDFGPDTYMHMLQHNLHLTQIKHVLITHCHQDHFYIDDLLTRAAPFGNADGIMHVYGNNMLSALYHHNVVTRGIYPNTDKALRIVELEEFETVTVGGYEVTPLLADHNPAKKCFIYMIQKDGKTLLYANDTGYFKDEVWEYLKGRKFDLVSLDCNHLDMQVYHNHMSIPCCRKVRERLLLMNCIEKTTPCVLTHFSHNHGGIQEELETLTKGMGFFIAYDGFSIEV